MFLIYLFISLIYFHGKLFFEFIHASTLHEIFPVQDEITIDGDFPVQGGISAEDAVTADTSVDIMAALP